MPSQAPGPNREVRPMAMQPASCVFVRHAVHEDDSEEIRYALRRWNRDAQAAAETYKNILHPQLSVSYEAIQRAFSGIIKEARAQNSLSQSQKQEIALLIKIQEHLDQVSDIKNPEFLKKIADSIKHNDKKGLIEVVNAYECAAFNVCDPDDAQVTDLCADLKEALDSPFCNDVTLRDFLTRKRDVCIQRLKDASCVDKVVEDSQDALNALIAKINYFLSGCPTFGSYNNFFSTDLEEKWKDTPYTEEERQALSRLTRHALSPWWESHKASLPREKLRALRRKQSDLACSDFAALMRNFASSSDEECTLSMLRPLLPMLEGSSEAIV